ncbi:MAG: PIN domain-containing protein [Pirellulales bacterium]
MNAIDTNVLVNRLDRSEPKKRAIARKLIYDLANARDTILLWRVAGELTRQLSTWRDQGRLSHDQVVRLSRAPRRVFPLILPAEPVLDRALQYATTYTLSHWDSMLVAACAEAGVTTLYTEDMGAPRRIDTVELVNPF